MHGHENSINALAVLPKAVSLPPHTIALCASGKPQVTANRWFSKATRTWLSALVVLPDGRLASASHDRTVRIWETAGCGEPLVLKGHERRVRALAVLPDGRLASPQTIAPYASGRPPVAEPLVLKGHEDLSAHLLTDRRPPRFGLIRWYRTHLGSPHGHHDNNVCCRRNDLNRGSSSQRPIVAGDRTGAVHFLRLVER